MKSSIRKPDQYWYYTEEALMYNYNQRINLDVMRLLQTDTCYANIAARDFIAYVWWNDTAMKWAAEVWVKNEYQASYVAKTIDLLSYEINLDYGNNEVKAILN